MKDGWRSWYATAVLIQRAVIFAVNTVSGLAWRPPVSKGTCRGGPVVRRRCSSTRRDFGNSSDLQLMGILNDRQPMSLAHWHALHYLSESRNCHVAWIWQHLVPEVAVSHPYVLNGILTLSALPLACRTGDQVGRECSAVETESYQIRAIQMLQHVINLGGIQLRCNVRPFQPSGNMCMGRAASRQHH